MPPLVLLPGLHGTADLFAPFLRVLPSDLPTHVIPYPADRFLPYSELLSYLKRRIPKSPSVILAESFAGPLALQFTAAHPARVRALVLSASFARPPRSPLLRFLPLSLLFRVRPTGLTNRLLLGKYATPDLQTQLNIALASLTPALLAARFREVLSTDAIPALRATTCPILYLRATHDRLVPRRALTTLQAHRPDIAVQEIDAPHLLLQTAPAQAWTAIQTFLSETLK